MIKKIMCLVAVMIMIIAMDVKAHDCVPSRLSHVKKSNKYLLKTVKAETYAQAQMKLRQETPQMGFLQKVKAEEKRILEDNKFSQRRTLKSSLTADVDLWLKYECKHQGEYYITAIIAKDDIKYVDFTIPKALTLKNIKKTCGSRKVFILGSTNGYYTIKSRDKMRIKSGHSEYRRWELSCGETEAEVKVYSSSARTYVSGPKNIFNNKFDNFTVIITDGARVHDRTADFWLELTKRF